MKADVFYLANQDDQAARLRLLLRTHIYPDISVALQKFETPTWSPREGILLGERYVKLLQAAVPPEVGMRFGLGRLESLGTRFYISVYYPFATFSSRVFRDDSLRKFFPAVAVRDRMVLVPQGLSKELKNENEIPLFKPLESGGVLEIDDFDDVAALTVAVQSIGRALRCEVLNEAAAYSSYQDPAQFDLGNVAKNLGVDVGYVQHSLQQEGLERPVYDQLTCTLDTQKVPASRWTKVTLVISNNSDTALSKLGLAVSGPVKLLPKRIETDVAPHSTACVLLSIMPEAPGDFPIEITLFAPNDKVVAGFLPVHHIWLECD